MELEYSVTDNYNREQKLVLATSGPPYSTHVPRIRHTINCLDYTSYQNYQTPKFNISKAKGTSNYLDWNKYAVVCCGVPSFQCPATDG